MHTIELTHNYNGKMFNQVFGAVLPLDITTHVVGNQVLVKLKGIDMGTAVIVAVKRFEFKTTNDILAFLEMGRPAAYLAEVIRRQHTEKVFPDTMIDHVIMEYTRRNLQTTGAMLQAWWKEFWDSRDDDTEEYFLPHPLND